jgi:hypothetical protein
MFAVFIQPPTKSLTSGFLDQHLGISLAGNDFGGLVRPLKTLSPRCTVTSLGFYGLEPKNTAARAAASWPPPLRLDGLISRRSSGR